MLLHQIGIFPMQVGKEKVHVLQFLSSETYLEPDRTVLARYGYIRKNVPLHESSFIAEYRPVFL